MFEDIERKMIIHWLEHTPHEEFEGKRMSVELVATDGEKVLLKYLFHTHEGIHRNIIVANGFVYNFGNDDWRACEFLRHAISGMKDKIREVYVGCGFWRKLFEILSSI